MVKKGNNKKYSKHTNKEYSSIYKVQKNRKKYPVKKVKVKNVYYEDDFIKSSKRKNYKIFITTIFIFFLLYIFGYLIVFVTKPRVSVESVRYGTIEVPSTYKGIITRDEKVFNTPIDGQPFFEYSENERVKKDSTVCVIKKDDTANIIEENIEKIDEDILQKQKNRGELSIFKDDIERIEKDIKNNVNLYSSKLIDGDMSAIYSMQRSLNGQIELRNNIWLTENNSTISELNDKRKSYENQLSESRANIVSDVSGIISYTIDGMEDTLDYSSPETITEEQTKMKIESNNISKNKNIKAQQPVFKIVKSNIWYLTSYVPSDAAALWNVGDRKILYTNFLDENIEINVVIDSIEQLDKNTRVVFSSNESLEKIIDLRNIDFKIKDEIYEGIKIPNNAIVEKTLLKIPSEYIVENNNEKGVFKVIGDEIKFVPLMISKQIEANPEEGVQSYVYILQDFDTLKIGDVLVKDKLDQSKDYKISDVEVYKGVYVVNSSVATFKIIDIIAQNNEYSIVKTGDLYGLKVYDNIVSDAKNVQESDSIY